MTAAFRSMGFSPLGIMAFSYIGKTAIIQVFLPEIY
jgi:hypothetical protein